MSTEDRIYSEEQVRKMLSRAAERQQQAQDRLYEASAGLTMAEIERIAAESGIDPQFLTAAAADVEGPEVSTTEGRLLGAPAVVRFEQTLPGSLTEDAIASMVHAIRKLFAPAPGSLETLGRSFEWRDGNGKEFTVVVRASTEEGMTHLTVEQINTQWAIAAHAPGAVFLAVSILLMIGPRLALHSFALFLVAMLTLFVGRFTLDRLARQRTRKLGRLFKDLSAVPLDQSGRRSASTTAAPGAATIPLPDAEEDDVQNLSGTRGRSRT